MFHKKRKSPIRQTADQSSKRVYSYYSNTRLRAEEQSERSRQSNSRPTKKSGPKWWHHTPTFLALVVILACLGYILSVNTNPKIVQVSGAQSVFLRSKNTYQQAANKIINNSFLNYNKVTFNVGGISAELKKQFPELSEVSISMPIINRRPVIYISASRPALVLITNDNSLVVDERGMAVLPSAQLANLTSYDLPTVRDKSGLASAVGKSVLTAADVKFILDTCQQFKLVKQAVDQLTLPAIPNELDVKLSGKHYFIKMDLQGDSREEAGAFLASEAKFKSLNADPRDYVDVRVAGRVYYK